MEKLSVKEMLKRFVKKNGLIIIIALLIIAPLFINIGLMIADRFFLKTGIMLTAIGLNNENWLEFWKDYISIAIAFLGIYLVWDSSNTDRKKHYNKDLAEQYMQNIRQEEKILVEVSQCFNTGIIYKSLLTLGNLAVKDSRLVLQDSRDKIDEAHVKFELLTELSDDFQKCVHCKYNPCRDKKIMQEIRDMFYDMEVHFVNMLNLGEEYCNKVLEGQRNVEMIDIHMKLAHNLKQQIYWSQNGNCTLDEVYNLQKQLAEEEQQLKKLNETKLDTDILNEMVKPIHKEIDYISKTMRPKFNKYCKFYIEIKKKHAMELRMDGIINYVKVDDIAENNGNT